MAHAHSDYGECDGCNGEKLSTHAKVVTAIISTLVLAFAITMFIIWQAADTPKWECWTPTHIDYASTYPTIYTSDGQQLGPNGHEGLFVEGRPWCGWVGHSIGAGRDWIEDSQGPQQGHASG